MSKGFKKIFLSLIAVTLLLIAGGCSEKDQAGKKDEIKQAAADQAKKDPKSQEKAVSDFLLKNTKIVKIFNISQRVNPQTPDLGPFFVIRGIDERGQKSEVWVKDLKIYEMNSSQ